MERSTVIGLLGKYWQAETTLAEEQALADYFRGGDVDPGLEAYRDVFSYFHEEARVSAGPDFGNRILQRLGLPLEGEGAGDIADSVPAQETPVVPMTRQPFRLGVVGAAAAILFVLAGLFLLGPAGQPTKLADTRLAAQTRPTTDAHGSRIGGGADIVDTYDDPEQALAAVRRALLVASRNLNQGRREITGTSK